MNRLNPRMLGDPVVTLCSAPITDAGMDCRRGKCQIHGAPVGLSPLLCSQHISLRTAMEYRGTDRLSMPECKIKSPARGSFRGATPPMCSRWPCFIAACILAQKNVLHEWERHQPSKFLVDQLTRVAHQLNPETPLDVRCPSLGRLVIGTP